MTGLSSDYWHYYFVQVVIRFNGGQQAGHTVVLKNGTRHVFSNFGSGTLRGIPTYWSAYCSFSPRYILEELSLLPTTPTLYLDPACPVTTHYDVLYNRALELSRGENRYGSCGVGFGATIDRHKQRRLRLTVTDILSPKVVYRKLQQIRAYYQDKLLPDTGYDFSLFDHDQEDAQLMADIWQLALLKKEKIIQVVGATEIFRKRIWREYIFEGAQGIQLDQSFGRAPYITKSNTTSQNAKNCYYNTLT